tara:strand:- start:613 stop:1068 length:456 start_codon:yes stop_codon:yes gene_type:complete
MSDYRKTHTKEDIDAAIEAVNEEMSFIGHGFTDNQLKTILAALEQYKQPQASNTEAFEALDRILMSYKLMLNNIELGTPKNEDGSKTFPPWLRDCRNDLKLSETLHSALTNPPANTVDVEALKQEHITETGNTSGLIIFDWLVEKGIINAE